MIFKYISDKDVFENYYKNLLSKRLLGGKTGEGTFHTYTSRCSYSLRCSSSSIRRSGEVHDCEAQSRVRLPVHHQARGHVCRHEYFEDPHGAIQAVHRKQQYQ